MVDSIHARTHLSLWAKSVLANWTAWPFIIYQVGKGGLKKYGFKGGGAG